MRLSHVTARGPACVCAALVLPLAGCGGLSERPADGPMIFYDAGDAWTTPKRNVHMYQCRNSAMVCDGPASYLDVSFHFRSE
jgi:hypothetical protein